MSILLYWTGMREGELLALTAIDIDPVAKQIDINKTYQRLHGEDIITTPKTRKSNPDASKKSHLRNKTM